MAKNKQNAGVVERSDSNKQTTKDETKVYQDEVKRLTGTLSVPSVLYKGKLIESANLGDRQFLTSTLS
jgi:hypothetical protein